VCSDDDLRAIVHEHQLRWSPQSTSACRDHRSSRASSLDTSHSQYPVFSSSAESLSQSPVLPGGTTHSVRLQSEHSASAVLPQSVPISLAVSGGAADTQPQRQVGLLIGLTHSTVTVCVYIASGSQLYKTTTIKANCISTFSFK